MPRRRRRADEEARENVGSAADAGGVELVTGPERQPLLLVGRPFGNLCIRPGYRQAFALWASALALPSSNEQPGTALAVREA